MSFQSVLLFLDLSEVPIFFFAILCIFTLWLHFVTVDVCIWKWNWPLYVNLIPDNLYKFFH
jgi:hypothetical protein